MKVQVENGIAACPECNIPIAIGYDPDEGLPTSVEVYHIDEGHIVDRPNEEPASEETPPEEQPTGEHAAAGEEAAAATE